MCVCIWVCVAGVCLWVSASNWVFLSVNINVCQICVHACRRVSLCVLMSLCTHHYVNGCIGVSVCEPVHQILVCFPIYETATEGVLGSL